MVAATVLTEAWLCTGAAGALTDAYPWSDSVTGVRTRGLTDTQQPSTTTTLHGDVDGRGAGIVGVTTNTPDSTGGGYGV